MANTFQQTSSSFTLLQIDMFHLSKSVLHDGFPNKPLGELDSPQRRTTFSLTFPSNQIPQKFILPRVYNEWANTAPLP